MALHLVRLPCFVVGPWSHLGDDHGCYYIKHDTKVGSAERAPARDYYSSLWTKSAWLSAFRALWFTSARTESVPRVIPATKCLIRYHEFWVCLSEWATCLSALTATRDYGIWGPRRRQFLPKATQMSQFSIVGLIVGVSGYCLSPRGKMVGLVPGQSRNVQVCFGVIGRRSP